MPLPLPESIFDAERISRSRGVMPTDLSTAELRELGAEVLARAVFTARGTNAVFMAKVDELINRMLAGELGESQVRAALYQTLRALGYTPEGGFPGDEGAVPPALRGTLQDLSSFRRLDLIVRTQVDLMQGAGEQWRGQQPEMLRAFPAWELIRVLPVTVPRDWPSRWVIAGGRFTGTDRPGHGPGQDVPATGRMIALKGDPIWGELGSYENFPDALGVDHPPFAFNSGMGWRAVPAAEVAALGITGPEGESAGEWIQSGDGVTLAGRLPALPRPRLSLDGVPAELIEQFKKENFATVVPGTASTVDYSDRLARSIAARDAARKAREGGGQ